MTSLDPGLIHSQTRPLVYVRQSWADSWELMPYLYCDSVSYSIGGAFGRADLSYEYGTMLRPEAIAWDVSSPLEIDRWYVKAVYTPNSPQASPMTWYGVIVSSQHQAMGVGLGNQRFAALTLDWLLTQKQITAAYVESGETTERIERAITFNEREGATFTGPDKPRGNRSVLQNGGLYHFAEILDGSSLWRSADMLMYLLAYFQPHGGSGPEFTANYTDLAEHLHWFTPTVKTEGRTLYDVINAIIDSRRGIAWYIVPTESQVNLVVASYSASAVTLPGAGGDIPANVNQLAITANTEKAVVQSVVVTDSQQQYSQVRAIGNRRATCFTLRRYDGNLVKDWTNDQETAYQAGDTTASADDLSRRNAANDELRRTDPYKHVYTRFRLPEGWDGLASGGEHVCPGLDPATGILDGTFMKLWVTGLRFEDWLPLLEWHDYRNSIDTPETPVDMLAIPGYRKPFAVAKIGEKYYLTHDLSVTANDETAEDGGSQFSSTVSSVPDAPSLEVMPSSVPHAQALNAFSGATNGSDVEPTFEYTQMYVTVFAEVDAYAEAVYPGTAGAAINDQQSVLTVRLGDRARIDYVVRGTVLDVENGALVTAAQSGFTRNDGPLLRDTARMAYLWYSTPRRAITMRISHISSYVPLAYLITSYDGVAVNSLVTQLEHDFTTGHTAVQTNYADIDPGYMIR